jgi:transglutaminase-like putative cysteine protease
MTNLKVWVTGAAVAWAALAMAADESWMGIYLQGNKIGYVGSTQVATKLDGKAAFRTTTTNVLKATMLGSDLDLDIWGESWTSPDGTLVKMTSKLSSGGRTQTFTALRKGNAFLVEMTNGGQKSKKTLTMKPSVRVVDDATADALKLLAGKGEAREVFVLDPVTVSLVPNTIRLGKRTRVKVRTNEFTADVVEIVDPRATTYVYLDSQKRIIKVTGPIGMELYPESKSVAMKMEKGARIDVDLGESASITLAKPLERASATRRVEYRVSRMDLSRIRTDDHQTVTKDNDSWLVTVHPSAPTSATMAAIKGQKLEFTAPTMLIPSDLPAMKKLAAEIIGNAPSVHEAANRVQSFVADKLRSNTGIGVLRDATEVLKTAEGLCRDHAILCATLLRAAGIPTRLVSGLVYENGAFYYHAWVEVWQGTAWVGYDSTRPAARLSAAHFKLADGNVEEAFLFIVLDGARIEVRSVSYDEK